MAYNKNIELVLPEDMSVVGGDNTISLGDLPVSNKQIQVFMEGKSRSKFY